MTRARAIRIVLTLAITGACLAYLLWKLDVRNRAQAATSRRLLVSTWDI